MLEDRIQKKKLKMLKRFGFDVSNPKNCILQSIDRLIKVSVPSHMSKEEMKEYLNRKINELK